VAESARAIDLAQHRTWQGLQLAVLLLPFSALLGSVGCVCVAIALWRQRFATICRRPSNWALAALSGLMGLSAVLSPQPGEAALGLFNFLPLFFVFAGLREGIHTPAHLRRLAQILVFGSIPVVLIGLGQQFWGLAGRFQLLWALTDWRIDPTGNPPGRMASIFFYANVLASYLVVTFSLSLGLLLDSLERQPRPTPYRRLLGVALVANAVALILTNSRNAWAVAMLIGVTFVVYRGWRWLLAGLGAIAAAVLGAAFAPAPISTLLRRIVPTFFWARLNDQLYPNRPVGDLRSTQWQFAWDLAQQRPWTGWGLRNFSPLYQAKWNFFIGHPHNLYLMLAAEIGWPGLLLFAGIVGSLVWQAARGMMWAAKHRTGSPRAGQDSLTMPFAFLTTFLAVAVFGCLDVTLFDVRINLLGWLLLAGICGWSDRQSERPIYV
jgi:O-antigen ligase